MSQAYGRENGDEEDFPADPDESWVRIGDLTAAFEGIDTDEAELLATAEDGPTPQKEEGDDSD